MPEILRDAVAAALYVPNISFAIEQTDYLAGTAPSPFQHFWSLGVEEQFYLFWPVILIAVFSVVRGFRRRFTAGIALIAVASFVACLMLSQVSQPWAFFSLPTRAWELAAGALLAVAAPVLAKVTPPASGILTWLGLAIILYGAVALSEQTPYPGIATLIPVVGTCLLIGFGSHGGQGASLLLRTRVFQFLGAISYSLYLVHWPLLVLAHERAGLGSLLPLDISLFLAAVSVPVAGESTSGRDTIPAAKIHPPRPIKTIAVGVVASVVLSATLLGAEPPPPHAASLHPRGCTHQPYAVAEDDLCPPGTVPNTVEASGDTGEFTPTDASKVEWSRGTDLLLRRHPPRPLLHYSETHTPAARPPRGSERLGFARHLHQVGLPISEESWNNAATRPAQRGGTLSWKRSTRSHPTSSS